MWGMIISRNGNENNKIGEPKKESGNSEFGRREYIVVHIYIYIHMLIFFLSGFPGYVKHLFEDLSDPNTEGGLKLYA